MTSVTMRIPFLTRPTTILYTSPPCPTTLPFPHGSQVIAMLALFDLKRTTTFKSSSLPSSNPQGQPIALFDFTKGSHGCTLNSMQWTSILVPTAERRVAEAIECAYTFQVLRANEAEFEVISHEGTNVVDIRNRFCLCRGWQLYGLPCAHAVAALLSCRQNVHRFTESCFTLATYRKTYSQTIYPIPDKSPWKELSEGDPSASKATEVVINPPKSLQPPGRPRKKRVLSEDRGRVKRVVHCSHYNQTGHFRTTCAAPV